MRREQIIDYLVEADMDYLLRGDPDQETLESFLRFGHRGYHNYTDAELVSECHRRQIMMGLG